jgi:hypothetical protein
MGASGCGALVGDELACRFADVVEQKLIGMSPDHRLLRDQSVTSKPKKTLILTPESDISEIDVMDAYSASYEWLVMFRDFCRTSGGFKVS